MRTMRTMRTMCKMRTTRTMCTTCTMCTLCTMRVQCVQCAQYVRCVQCIQYVQCTQRVQNLQCAQCVQCVRVQRVQCVQAYNAYNVCNVYNVLRGSMCGPTEGAGACAAGHGTCSPLRKSPMAAWSAARARAVGPAKRRASNSCADAGRSYGYSLGWRLVRRDVGVNRVPFRGLGALHGGWGAHRRRAAGRTGGAGRGMGVETRAAGVRSVRPIGTPCESIWT
jgi:hypothetical protein